MIKSSIYYKFKNETEKKSVNKGKIEELYVFNENGYGFPFSDFTPVINDKFIYDSRLNYMIHPATLNINKKKINIAIGFIQSKDHNEMIFSIKTDEDYLILNPFGFNSDELIESNPNLSVFVNGKMEFTKQINKDIIKDITPLDFYPIVDKIFNRFEYFDAVLGTTGIIVSLKVTEENDENIS